MNDTVGHSSPLSRGIATFYRRWHALEASLGPDAGSILDFDYCPPELCDDGTPFTDRLAALDALTMLREQLEAADSSLFVNQEFLSAKLLGSETYLRALMGERFPFATYIRNLLGISAEPLPEQELAALRHDACTAVAGRGIAWTANARQEYEAQFTYGDVSRFAPELRRHAAHWVSKVQAELGLETEPYYLVDEVQEDAYWQNWIDGTLGKPIQLKINTHPRIPFKKCCDISLAAHEIAGHAVNILELDAGRRLGRVDAAAMNTTTHTLELFQMEGIAQSVLMLLGPEEVTEELHAYHSIQTYHRALIQQGHIEIESGRPIAETVRHIIKQAPFLEPKTMLSDLRDRCRHPLFRALIFVYYPSCKTFLCAARLSHEAKREFLRIMYQQFWTPRQIFEHLELLSLGA